MWSRNRRFLTRFQKIVERSLHPFKGEVAIAESCQLGSEVSPAEGYTKQKSNHETNTAQAE